MTFHLIPHTHWDREWYLPRAVFQSRLVPMLDAVIGQLESDPAARFVLDGQTILLEDYLAIRPDQESRISALVNRGALEIGPWYVLSDLLIPSAESLRHNLREGTRQSARFGRRMDVLYSPDAFGHPAGLPDLANEFGIARAVVRRGLGTPKDFYRWRGSNGGELLVHHLPRGGYDIAIDLTAPDVDLATAWPPIRNELLQRATTSEIAVFLGADHHGLVRNVSALCQQLQSIESEDPLRVSSLTEYFDAVERTALKPPEIQGELRNGGGHTWLLPDVLSARSRLKRFHAAAEWELSRVAEPLAILAQKKSGVDRAPLLEFAWRSLLQSQFHDTLAGSTSDEAQLEQRTRLNSVNAIAREVALNALSELTGHDPDAARDNPGDAQPSLILWNPAASPSRGIMTAELTFFREDVLVGPPSGRVPRQGDGYRPFVLIDQQGRPIPVQVLSLSHGTERIDSPNHYPDQDEVDRVTVAFEAPELKAMEWCRLVPTLQAAMPGDQGLLVREGSLRNEFVAVSISQTGVLDITDLQTGEEYRGLLQLIDEEDVGDLYTFSRGEADKAPDPQPVSQMMIANGPLVGAIETHWSLSAVRAGGVRVRQVVTLCADSPVVRLSLDINNGASGHRLRARFPIGPVGAIAGSAFGVERRMPVPYDNTPAAIEATVATAPAHRFVATATGERGLLLASPICFEYEATPEGDMLVTLLRAVGELAREGLPERPGRAAWPVATPLAQEHGEHHIEIALSPITERDTVNGASVSQLAERAILPTVAVFVRSFLPSQVG